MATGTNLSTRNPNLPQNVFPGLITKGGMMLFGSFDTLSTPPTNANTFMTGCHLIKTDTVSGSPWWVNTGTVAIPSWTQVTLP